MNIFNSIFQFKLSFLIKYSRKIFTNDPDLAIIHCGLW